MVNEEYEWPDSITILRQAVGRFDRRFPVGPVCWPHFDLLWVFDGGLTLSLGGARVTLAALSGVLIWPGVDLSGHSTDRATDAAICHFDVLGAGAVPGGPWRQSRTGDGLALQAIVRLSLKYAASDASAARNTRLLRALLDGFSIADRAMVPADPMSGLWERVQERLGHVRTLADVAALGGVSESALRARHRSVLGGSAGSHLRDMRLTRAARLLETTGQPVAVIARAVGYAHPESLAAAFRKQFGQSPRSYRTRARQFA